MAGRIVEVQDEGYGATFKTDDGMEHFVVNGPHRQELERTAEAAGATFSSAAPTQSTVPASMQSAAPPAPRMGTTEVVTEPALAQTAQTLEQQRAAEEFNRLHPEMQNTLMRIQQGKRVVTPARPEIAPVRDYGARPVMPGSQSGYMNVGESATVRSAQPYSEEYRRGAADLAEQESKLAWAQTQRATAENVREGMRAQTEALQYKDRADAWEARQREIDAEVQRSRAKLAQLHQAYEEHQVDPNRLFRDNPIAAIGAAIAIGLGASGATLSGSPNFAQPIIDNAIARDIDAQKAERDKLGRAADNALTRLESYFGDRRQAEVALEQLQRAAAEKQRASLVARTNVPALQQQYQEFLMGQQKAKLERDRQFELASRDVEIQRTERRQLQEYQAAQAGGVSVRPFTDEERQKMLLGTQHYLEGMGVVLTPEQKAKLQLEEAKAGTRQTVAGETHTREQTDTLRKELAATADAETALRDYADAMGMKQRPDGTWEAPEGDIPATGATSAVPEITLSPEGRRVKYARERAARYLVRAVSGATARADEVEAETRGLQGVWDRDAVQGFQAAWETLNAKRNALREGAGPEVVSELEQRTQGVARRDIQRAATLPPEPTPRNPR
jgi:uncharacterized protein YukE